MPSKSRSATQTTPPPSKNTVGAHGRPKPTLPAVLTNVANRLRRPGQKSARDSKPLTNNPIPPTPRSATFQSPGVLAELSVRVVTPGKQSDEKAWTCDSTYYATRPASHVLEDESAAPPDVATSSRSDYNTQAAAAFSGGSVSPPIQAGNRPIRAGDIVNIDFSVDAGLITNGREVIGIHYTAASKPEGQGKTFQTTASYRPGRQSTDDKNWMAAPSKGRRRAAKTVGTVAANSVCDKTFNAAYKAKKQSRPCLVLYKNQPRMDWLIVAPITSFENQGLDFIRDPFIISASHPIPPSKGREWRYFNNETGDWEGQVNEQIHIPGWRTDIPQYCLLGATDKVEAASVQPSNWATINVGKALLDRCRQIALDSMAKCRRDNYEL